MATRNRYILFLLMLIAVSCAKRDDFLNAKSDESLFVISTLEDCEKLLENEPLFNQSGPILDQVSTAEYNTSESAWLGEVQTGQNTYIWDKQIYPSGSDVADWSKTYEQIYVCNVVLDALKTVPFKDSQKDLQRRIRGTALLFRAIAFYNLAQVFALPYNSATAASTLGIPLRLSSDLNEKSFRSTLETCYQQIIADLSNAIQLLPVKTEKITLPNKAAGYGLLSRIYLAMSNYGNCKLYSDSSLLQYNKITDFNTITPNDYQLTDPSTPYLDEDIFHTTTPSLYTIISFTGGIVDSSLYNLYDSTDMRKTHFFTVYEDQIRFKGSLEFHFFDYRYMGVTTAEILLNRAECNARNGAITEAMADINQLLQKRYKTGSYIPKTVATKEEAVKLILIERQKELCFRSTRWTDLRRLNQDPNFSTTLTRKINGLTYTLPPNDPRYALPIPDNEINISGIEQNPR